MGYNKRRDMREAEMELEREKRYIGSMTLGSACSAGIVHLSVSCQRCTRRGRYRVTRLIDRHGAKMGLLDLKPILAADCRYRIALSAYDRCAVYYPGMTPSVIRPLL